MPLRHPGARFGLRHADPLPVKIEPVVIGARKLPVHIMLGMLRIRSWNLATVCVQPRRALCMTIGIENCGDQDDAVGQFVFYPGALCRGEVINDRQRCIHAA